MTVPSSRPVAITFKQHVCHHRGRLKDQKTATNRQGWPQDPLLLKEGRQPKRTAVETRILYVKDLNYEMSLRNGSISIEKVVIWKIFWTGNNHIKLYEKRQYGVHTYTPIIEQNPESALALTRHHDSHRETIELSGFKDLLNMKGAQVVASVG